MEEIFNNNRLISKYIFNTPDGFNVFLADIRHMPVHMHDGIELLYVLKGSLRVKISFNFYLLEEGDFLLINSTEVHGIESLSDSNRVIVMELDENLFKEKLFAFDIFFYRNLKTGKVNEVKERMKAILHLDMHADKMSSTAKSAMLREIVNICDEHFQMHSYDVNFQKDGTYAEHPLNSQRIKGVYEYLYLQNGSKKKLDELAEIIHIDKCYASRLIKSGLGKSFQESLNIINADRAEVLLLGTDLSVQHISETLNLSSLNYFCNIFKQCFGMTPQAYRKAYKGKAYPHVPMCYERINPEEKAPVDICESIEAILHFPSALLDNGNVFEKIIHSPSGKYKVRIEKMST